MLVRTRKNLYHPENLPLIQKFLGLRRGTKVLDVGCGCGFLSELCSNKTGPGTVIGVDNDQKLLTVARKRAKQDGTGVNYRRGDAYHLSFASNKFDLTTEQLVLVHLKDPMHAIREMMRVTKPGGWVAAFECIYEMSGNNEYNTIFDEPAYWALRDQIQLVFHEIVRQVDIYNRKRGLDRFLSIKLPSLFRSAGLEKVEARPFANIHTWQKDEKRSIRSLLEDRTNTLKRYGFRPSESWLIREAVEAGVSKRTLKRYTDIQIKMNQYSLEHFKAFEKGYKESLIAYTILAVKGRKPV